MIPQDPALRRPFFVLVGALALVGGITLAVRLGLFGFAPPETPDAPAPSGGEGWPEEIPTDPPLAPLTRDLMRQGEQALRDGRLAAARSYFVGAWENQRDCFTCYARMQIVEKVIEDRVLEAIRKGHAFLEEGRFVEATAEYELVRNLVPDPQANYHKIAAEGLALAREGQKQRLRR